MSANRIFKYVGIVKEIETQTILEDNKINNPDQKFISQ